MKLRTNNEKWTWKDGKDRSVEEYVTLYREWSVQRRFAIKVWEPLIRTKKGSL